jgi:hypothetical protein
MRRIATVFLILVHIVLVAACGRLPDTIAPAVAASIYLPLWPLSVVGLPVFSPAAPGGWASPSLFGWIVFIVIWSIFWWLLVAAVARMRS